MDLFHSVLLFHIIRTDIIKIVMFEITTKSKKKTLVDTNFCSQKIDFFSNQTLGKLQKATRD